MLRDIHDTRGLCLGLEGWSVLCDGSLVPHRAAFCQTLGEEGARGHKIPLTRYSDSEDVRQCRDAPSVSQFTKNRQALLVGRMRAGKVALIERQGSETPQRKGNASFTIRSNRYEVESIARPDLDVLSATDIAYPEWSKFREQLASKQSSRERMSYIDFFGDSPAIDKFRDDPETVRNAKSIFEEDWELAWHWL